MEPSRLSGDVVVIMAKYPELGRVKTRLMPALGAQGACDLYRAFLRDLAWQSTSRDWDVVWAVDPPGSDLSGIVGDVRSIDQEGADLAERMWRCFERLFGEGAERVVMIGADAPHLSPAGIALAFAALEENHVAVAASRDGGYCLIGLRAPYDLFTGIAMSTPGVLAATRERAAAQGLSLAIVAETFDVDEPEDVERLAELVRDSAPRLRFTAEAIRGLRKQD